MIQRNTILSPCDSTGITKVKCFHIYEKKKNQVGLVGNFLKLSIRKTQKKLKQIWKRKKIKGVLILTVSKFTKPDGSNCKFWYNNCILLKKRLTPKGRFVFGPVLYNIKRKKLLFSFILHI